MTADHGANPQAGEVAVLLAGRLRRLRPSFEAMVAIEAELGHALTKVNDRFLRQELTLMQLAVIVRHGLIAGGETPAPSTEQVAPEVYQAGYLNLIEPVAQFLANALCGGKVPGEPTAVGNGGPTSPTADTSDTLATP